MTTLSSMRSLWVCSLASSLCLVSAAQAAMDPTAMKGKLVEAETLFGSRETGSNMNQLLEIAGQTESSADADVKFGSLLLECKAFYFKGMAAKGTEDKTTLFAQGMAKCEAARTVKSEYAEAYYHYAQNLSAWSQVQGMSALIGRKAELLAYLHSTIALKTRDGRPGESLDGQGAKRELGKLYLRLPEHAGGSQSKAVEYLSEAQVKAPNFAENTSTLAEALMDGSDNEKSRARQMLKEFASKEKTDFDMARGPETAMELARAKELLKNI